MSWTCLMSMKIFTNMVHVQKKLSEHYVHIQLNQWDKKSSHLCTPTSKFSSLTDSTECIWMVTYFPSFFLTILHMNNLSISLGCQCCEKWSQIIDINLTKTSKISHYINSHHILNLISKQIFQIKTSKYIFPFIIYWKSLLMVSHDGPWNLQMSNFDLNMLSAVRIKQICILFEDLVYISMILLVLIVPK